ncbi:MAG: DUF924 family protein [Pseudomonadota bacterium]|nr:DUF924 family protein [Pseudomonadota bacterium]
MTAFSAPLATPADVLAFWLGAYPLSLEAMQRVQGQWFRKDEAFDARLREHFAPTLAAALRGELDAWVTQPEGRLALLIVLDQFTRNAFRGQPGSFAGDARALALAQEGLALGHDQHVPPMARIFCYLPLEHAEDLACQARSVALFAALAADPQAQPRAFFEATLDYARRHEEVIRRFGRFPHRNAILRRDSSAEERAYLAQPGSGF